MIIYKIMKNGLTKHMWDASTGNETYHEPAFGKPERWVTEIQEDVSNALETRQVEALGGMVTEHKLAAEYTVEIEDTTTLLLSKKESDDAKKYLADTDWMIIREMDSGELCPVEIKQLRAAARLKVV